MMGAERKSMVMSDKKSSPPRITRPVTPSSVAWCRSDPVYKVSIIPRGRACAGVTMFLPEGIATACPSVP